MERDVRQRATASGATTAPSSRRNEPFATTAAAAVAGENINYLPALGTSLLVLLCVCRNGESSGLAASIALLDVLVVCG
jgi:hypothetical protein